MNSNSPQINHEENSKGIPAHDRILNAALREQNLNFDIQRAWRQQETARDRPLPAQVMALRKLLPSAVAGIKVNPGHKNFMTGD
jgi:hypothetical protein